MSAANGDRLHALVRRHLQDRRPSIERIRTLCYECLDHDSSWWEFEKRCKELLAQETKTLRLLGNRTPNVAVRREMPAAEKEAENV